MKIKFSLDILESKEAMVGPIPVAMEASITCYCEYEEEKPVYYPNDEAYPGYQGTELLSIDSVCAMVDWYTAAPDGTMTVYHCIDFDLEGEAAMEWLNAWDVDVQGIIDKEGLTLDDIMD